MRVLVVGQGAREHAIAWKRRQSPLVKEILGKTGESAWRRFVRQYRREMRAPAADRLLELLARLSHHTSFSVGCYCEDEARCHRSILRALLAEKGAKISR